MKTVEMIMNDVIEKIEPWLENVETFGNAETKKFLNSKHFSIVEQTENYIRFAPMHTTGMSRDVEFYAKFKDNGTLTFGAISKVISASLNWKGEVSADYRIDKKAMAAIKELLDGWAARIGEVGKSVEQYDVAAWFKDNGFEFCGIENNRINFRDNASGYMGQIVKRYPNEFQIVGTFLRNEICAM